MGKLNEREVNDIISLLEEGEVSHFLHPSRCTIDTKKSRWKDKIKDKLEIRLNKMSEKNCEYYSELLTNICTQKINNARSVLFKALDSPGYDGVFIAEHEKKWKIFLSETKSSHHDAWHKEGNTYTKKIYEAKNDLRKKFDLIHTKSGSYARNEDIENVGNKVELLLTRTSLKDIGQDSRDIMNTQLIEITNGENYSHAIAAVASRDSQDQLLEINDNKTYINTILVFDNINSWMNTSKLLFEKLRGFYE